MAQRDGALSGWIPAGYSEFHATAQHGNLLPANGFAGKREVGRGEFAESGNSENRQGRAKDRVSLRQTGPARPKICRTTTICPAQSGTASRWCRSCD